MSLTMSIPVTFMIMLIGGILILIYRRNYTFPTINIKNPWAAGGLLLLINTAIIGLTFLLATHLMGAMLVLEIISPLLSIMVWVWIKASLNGDWKKRCLSSMLGQSIYIILFFLGLYRYVTLKPAFAGDDTFMAAIGLLFGMIVCFFATIIGLFIMLTPNPKTTRLH